jgi:hypothetical protein
MDARRIRVAVFLLLPLLIILSRSADIGHTQSSAPSIPKTWDDSALASLQLPLAEPGVSPKDVPADYYYRLPVRPIYRSYPVYHPSKEPAGYLDRLRRLEPEVIWDDRGHRPPLNTDADWIKAGELVFDVAPQRNSYPVSSLRDPAFYVQTRVPVARDGTVPFLRYVVTRKSEVEVQALSCATCHTRVMPDGTIVKGAQGNFPLAAADLFDLRRELRGANDERKEELQQFNRSFTRALFLAPWVPPDSREASCKSEVWWGCEGISSLGEYPAQSDSVTSLTGAMARTGSSPLYPVNTPDLIGIRERHYLDRTGLIRHRDIGDLMRYAALAQGGDLLARYGDFRPIQELAGKLPDPESGLVQRYSDEQLYALARYLYSLKPPRNPNQFNTLAARGKRVFEREGCTGCHTPPLYTNNKLTIAAGFTPPDDHFSKYDILRLSVGTDPNLALRTRRGTGYYKVPSLKGVWYRGPFTHDGSVLTLEDWFDPLRSRDDYVPTGFRGYGIERRAVKGHEFGLKLSPDDKRALIAFLKTL